MAKAILRLWDTSKVRVQYYREPASIRGILLDDVALCIGWYTYQNAKGEGTLIWGHDTGAVLVNADSEGFAPLRDFFMRVFRNISNTEDKDENDTIPLEKLLQEINDPLYRKDKITPSRL
jgi:hypothetical protein